MPKTQTGACWARWTCRNFRPQWGHGDFSSKSLGRLLWSTMFKASLISSSSWVWGFSKPYMFVQISITRSCNRNECLQKVCETAQSQTAKKHVKDFVKKKPFIIFYHVLSSSSSNDILWVCLKFVNFTTSKVRQCCHVVRAAPSTNLRLPGWSRSLGRFCAVWLSMTAGYIYIYIYVYT